jgi:hypothetical protein
MFIAVGLTIFESLVMRAPIAEWGCFHFGTDIDAGRVEFYPSCVGQSKE